MANKDSFWILTDTTITLEGLKDRTGTYVNDAVVSGTLKDIKGVTVIGGENIEFVYLAASDGKYEALLPNTVTALLKEDQDYNLMITATKSGRKWTGRMKRKADMIDV